jgi:penicillin-binding protein 1C
MLASDPAGKPGTLYGAAAAYLTREALAQKDRPDFPKRRDINKLPPQIHWKTGTSFGYRDAWSVGSDPAYTVAVWVGNVDNTPSHELVGSEAAGPLLFDVLDSLANRTRGATLPPVPVDLVEIEVCTYSGHIAGEACTSRTKALANMTSVPTTPCPYHQIYEVDHKTHEAVLPACRRDGAKYDRRSFVVLPSAVTAWLVERHRAVPEPPPFADGCAMQASPPSIVLPVVGQVITLIPGVPAENQVVPLQASTRAARVSWFVDGELVASGGSAERMYWTPTVGTHMIVVADEAGRKARRSLTVKMGASQIR